MEFGTHYLKIWQLNYLNILLWPSFTLFSPKFVNKDFKWQVPPCTPLKGKEASLHLKTKEHCVDSRRTSLAVLPHLLHFPYTLRSSIFLHSGPVVIKSSINTLNFNNIFEALFLYSHMFLCLVKLPWLNKYICFSPVNLSLSVEFSDLTRDPKTAEENCSFLIRCTSMQ